MAGITTTSCSFKLSTPISLRYVPKSLSLSFPSPLLLKSPPASRGQGRCLCHCARVVVARYGRGGGGYKRSRADPRDRFNSDDDELDLSRIRSATVRLIDQQQNMVGIVSKVEAIRMAEDAEQDLVILSADADPPVVRIMDYNKYIYELQKKKRDQQKKSSTSRMDIKEVKMGYNIEAHDYSVRLKAAQKFLQEGDKVKIVVNLKGRENKFRGNAIDLIKQFQEDIGELGIPESSNFKDRSIFMVLHPNKTVLQKVQGQPMKKEVSTNA